MSGNEAIARGAWEAGVAFATGYPGTPSTEVLENLAPYPEVEARWATNEKVAFDEGMGAALGGVRTLVTMKHVGLNVAADPFMVFPYAGTNAGFVVLVADDPGMYSSQNEQDSRYFAKVAKVPLLEPVDAADARTLLARAYEISEAFETPVMLRTTTRLAHTRGVVESGERTEAERREFPRDPRRWAIPVYARFRRPVLEEKLERLRDFAEEYEGNVIEEGEDAGAEGTSPGAGLGVITHGIPYQYVKEVAPGATVFRLGMLHPLPARRLAEFCARFDTVYVVEESEGFIQEALAAMGIRNVVGKERFTNIGELSADLVAAGLLGAEPPADFSDDITVLPRPPRMCAGCPHSGVFSALRKLRLVVTGDIGCYTLGCLPPLNAIDTTFCMGAGIGNATGFGAAGEERVVAVIGDGTFLHSGVPSLMSAVYNKSSTTVVLMDNGTTGMTGHQEHPGTGHTLEGEDAPAVDYETLIRAMGVEHVSVVDPWDLKAVRVAVKEAVAFEGPAVVIARRSCVLRPIAKTQSRLPYRVLEAECIECDYCLDSGCPALLKGDPVPSIREWECVGCGICGQLCPVDAILPIDHDAFTPLEA